ncbi:1,4-alpha-glucan branching enzyme [Mesobacillus persicus]|uniref:1,4-alpha-glucan branching enzyme GlgB n=1 Tax=Mesobacillus persicus TaxID=930146 RepID=A0A1H7Y5I7_9BACI|nr:1,4-alpha-glucan branching protein GlgB [Mesobacillus persicus]SEM41185.1 1,4-alpha-glucan branching enzyme [Mesobacillus persicus]
MLTHPSDYQLHLFHEGSLFESYELFGAHIINCESAIYTRFCVWAPTALAVRLVGDMNNWNGNGYEFEKVNGEGVWILVAEGDLTGSLYKFELTDSSGQISLKADPFAFYSELRPNTASIVYPLEGYQWNDQHWMRKREKQNSLTQPLAIYEVHLGSWRLAEDGTLLTYKQLANDLITYVLSHGYTHIEVLPLTEHPLDISWGYQGTGYYSVTSRFGTPHDFMYFVDQCHQNGIGVIMDWVPGHFCKDAHGLYCFDGSYVFDYQNPKDRENLVWGTANFDLGKTEVQSFLISNALFWLEKYHIDGFRVDAVANIIYWPNSHQEVNPYGVEFLKKLNGAVHSHYPAALMIAEDSTDWPKVTSPVEDGGLGFTYKWNMGWMNDMLSYMEKEPSERSQHHNKVTFSLLYAFTESFILPFSHDEVVHGKKSLLDKMPGDYWSKFAQLRLLLGYMTTHPGKKLTFMGTELGQFSEWKDKEQLDWHLLEYEMHEKLNYFAKEVLKIYKRNKPLYELDDSHEGFEWIDADNHQQSVFSFIRRGEKAEDSLIIVCNFTPETYSGYRIGVPENKTYREILNSDDTAFGGSGFINKKTIKAEQIGFHGRPFSIEMNISPFGISILRPVKKRKGKVIDAKEKNSSNAVSRRSGEPS